MNILLLYQRKEEGDLDNWSLKAEIFSLKLPHKTVTSLLAKRQFVSINLNLNNLEERKVLSL